MDLNRRTFLGRSGAGLAGFVATGSLAAVLLPNPARAAGSSHDDRGYGPLVPDPDKILDLPEGFRYRVLARAGEPLTGGGSSPSGPDGMGAFPAPGGDTYLVCNHELDPEELAEDPSLTAVGAVDGVTYDPGAVAGTTTLLIGPDRTPISHTISLAGTLDNCSGGATPWGTWLTCEENIEILGKPHGYVFEVNPNTGGNPEPIKGLGRFEHEAVSFDPRSGVAFLTEDSESPFGCCYRFLPARPLGGQGSLHAGGGLAAMKVPGVTRDLSEVTEAGTRIAGVEWIPVPNPDPGGADAPVRNQVIELGATPIPKCEGTWWGPDGTMWFVSSRADGPDAEEEGERTAGVHAGQIWSYDPIDGAVELVVAFPKGTAYDEPDNITVGPHGFALACTDSDEDQWLLGITPDGSTFPFGFNALNEEEFAGVTFSPDGSTLFVNMQGPPGLTVAIWGPWRRPTARRR